MSLRQPILDHADEEVLEALRAHLRPLTGKANDYDDLLNLAESAQFVLLGEASHGTYEFYRERAEITKRLILERQCRAVAVEGDWPDAWRVNRFVRGLAGDADARSALSGFRRFPSWMWRNTVVLDFVEWLRNHNRGLPPLQRVGFYGLDLYSMFTSIAQILAHLDRTDPEAARRARARYECFDHADGDSQAYGYGASFGLSRQCEDEVVQQLHEMNRLLTESPKQPGPQRDEAFFARQNALLVKNAEEYYRTMFRGRVSSWNLRDSHMAQTLQALASHLAQECGDGKPRIAVWAHNSHLGDARATEMGRQGEWNLGQLLRERAGTDALLVGFSTYSGTVTAASDWDEPHRCMRVRPGLPGSWEQMFHQTGEPRFLMTLRGNDSLRSVTTAGRLQRAIGVIYRPETERSSHYFYTRLADQFDAIVHIDQTSALEPLDPTEVTGSAEPETFPSGI
jgi:erythromycin esterase-like protein